MSNIFKDLQPYNKENRNVFDWSESNTFSTKVGMAQPVCIEECVQDTTLRLDLGAICRTAAMQKANFTSISANIDFFFVPYRQLWSAYPAFFYGRDDKQQNYNNAFVVNPVLPQSVPTFDLYQVVRTLFISYCFFCVYQELESIYLGSRAGNKYNFLTDESDGTRERMFLRLAELRSLAFEDVVDAREKLSEITFVDVHRRICVEDMVRNLDMLGYGNFYPVFKIMRAYIHERFEQCKAVTDWTLAPVKSDCFWATYSTFFNNEPFDVGDYYSVVSELVGNLLIGRDYKLVLEYTDTIDTVVDICQPNIFKNLIDSLRGFYPSALPIMAYYKIWADYYRNNQYDNADYSYLYNCDYYQRAGDSRLTSYKILRMLIPVYHQYKKDMFTGGYPNAQFGETAVAGLTPEYSDFVVKGSSSSSESEVAADANNMTIDNVFESGEALKIANKASVSALAIRQALAIQRWKESLLRAGNREKDLLRAMFGVSSRYVQDKYVDYVASFSGKIDVNPVASTMESEDINLGDLGSYAVGTIGGKEFEFNTNEPGLLIGILYVFPETKYESYGFSPAAMRTEQTDFYIPYFQNLGLAPVTSYYYNYMTGIEDGNKPDGVVLNYLSRYFDYKTKISKVHGDFYNTLPFNFNPDNPDLSIATMNDAFSRSLLACARGSKSTMVSVRDALSLSHFTKRSIYISPDCLDSLFYVNEDGTYSTDQFDVELALQVKAILPMSVDGLPNY